MWLRSGAAGIMVGARMSRCFFQMPDPGTVARNGNGAGLARRTVHFARSMIGRKAAKLHSKPSPVGG